MDIVLKARYEDLARALDQDVALAAEAIRSGRPELIQTARWNLRQSLVGVRDIERRAVLTSPAGWQAAHLGQDREGRQRLNLIASIEKAVRKADVINWQYSGSHGPASATLQMAQTAALTAKYLRANAAGI